MRKHYMYNFFLLEGNNGATYILNVQNTDALITSLKFYKARTLKQKVMKIALMLYIKSLKILCKVAFCRLKSQKEIHAYLKKLTDLPIDFELDNNCSLLVSPTRDKIIVHHHASHFHKFAFGSSYSNVKNEANIYLLLDKSLQHVRVSRFYDHEDHQTYYCFKLGSQSTSKQREVDLVSGLVELFNVSKKERQRFGVYLQGLRDRCKQNALDDADVLSVLDTLVQRYASESFPLGLVHRDFKHWNTNTENGLLIYDFEEAITDGPPMEDLFNFIVDPIIAYLPAKDVIEKLLSESNKRAYEQYLEQLCLDLDVQVLLSCYLVERALFYSRLKDTQTRVKYINLLHYLRAISTQKNKKHLL